MIILFGILISPIYAVSDIEISPSNPVVGDTITLTGKASPNEAINCQAWFEVNPTKILLPDYGYDMYGVELPSPPNNFKVIAENVNDAYVCVNMGIWITISSSADSNGIATVSKSNVPEGTYDITIGGTIKDQSKPVKLKIIASTTINADENGNFKYAYKTNNIPEGTTIYLSVGGVNKEIIIKGDTPAPPAPSVVDTTNTTNNTDNEPPKITILSPSKRDYTTSTVDFEAIVEDVSDYTIKFYLNGNRLGYNESSSHYTGTINLKEGENTFKITAKDAYDNENSKIIYINYYKPKSQEIENTENNKVEDNIASSQNTTFKNIENTENNIQNNNNPEQEENIIYGTVIKHIDNATLTISDGTKINTEGDVQIKKVELPNTTIAYYIAPKNAEFSKPLTLEISLNVPDNKELKILYYDEKLKSWKNIPYIYDKNNSEITMSITKSGYYAIKENEILENNNSMFGEIVMVTKIVITTIIKLIISKLNLA